MKKLLILGAGTLLLNILFFSIFPLLATAQGNYTPLAPIKIGGEGGKDFVGDTVQTDDLSKYVNNMFRLGIAAAVALAVLMIIVGGIEYMSTDAIGKKQDGQARINAALLGLVVALGSYMLLNTINPNILNTEFELDALPRSDTIPFISAAEIDRIDDLTINNKPIRTEVANDGTRTTWYDNDTRRIERPTGSVEVQDRDGRTIASTTPPSTNPSEPPAPCEGTRTYNPRLTAYSPQGRYNSMEGGYESSKPGLDGRNIVRTLDDYAAGRSRYITLAGDDGLIYNRSTGRYVRVGPSVYNRSYVIPSITFIDGSGQRRTLTNVPGYVHDTGPAFDRRGDTAYDVPVARDRGNAFMNSQPFNGRNTPFTDCKKI
jgi:hypothetical protein